MPIARHLRHLYRTPEAIAARKRCMERAGNKCESCGKPHMERVHTLPGGLWFDKKVHLWKAPAGQLALDLMLRLVRGQSFSRKILVKVGPAHLDHDPSHNDDDNLRALCQRCHLVHDRLQHKHTRATRKDLARPLLRSEARI